MDWIVKSRNGIWLPQIDWWLDAPRPAPRSIISHAHADHVAQHGEALCTPATADLMTARGGRFRAQLRCVDFGVPTPITPSATLTFFPAGHVLGSALTLIEHPDFGRLLYTGDFKLRPSATAETCEPPTADVLIMETTFARPHYLFPPLDEIRQATLAFCRDALEQGEIPVLLGYSLGRSQEILHLFTGTDFNVMLHPTVERVTRVYEAWGRRFPPYTSFMPMLAPGHVIIAPQQAVQHEGFAGIAPCRTAVLTGWALDRDTRYRGMADAAFPLSDHAGHDDLLRMVERVRPRRVFTVHGFATEFAATLRARGIEAWALGRTNQLELDL